MMDLWVWGTTPPPSMVSLISVSRLSSPLLWSPASNASVWSPTNLCLHFQPSRAPLQYGTPELKPSKQQQPSQHGLWSWWIQSTGNWILDRKTWKRSFLVLVSCCVLDCQLTLPSFPCQFLPERVLEREEVKIMVFNGGIWVWVWVPKYR